MEDREYDEIIYYYTHPLDPYPERLKEIPYKESKCAKRNLRKKWAAYYVKDNVVYHRVVGKVGSSDA